MNDSLNEFADDEVFRIEITDVLDLHSFAPRDVRRVTEEYLKLARAKNYQIVRIIHGKGIGVQREMVRKILSESEFVKSFKDAEVFFGHWGATIAKLNE